MIGLLIEMLNVSEFYGESELIEIAKGRDKLENTIKGKEKQLTRRKKWRSKRR